MYLPPSNPTIVASPTQGPPHATPAPRPTTPAHTLRHTRPPTPRSLLRTQSRPTVGQTMTARLLTPPPTSNSRPRLPQVTTDPPSPGTGLVDQPSDDDDVIDQPHALNEQRSRLTQPSSSSTPKPRDRNLTLLYPLLVRVGMLGYFKIEDGVSYRSTKGKYRHGILTAPLLTVLGYRCPINIDSDQR